MIAVPPFEAGAVHDTTERESAPEVAVTVVGAPGTVAGTAGADGRRGRAGAPPLVPAVTVKV